MSVVYNYVLTPTESPVTATIQSIDEQHLKSKIKNTTFNNKI